MNIAYDIKRRFGHIALPLIGFVLTGYFVYHALQGERGLLAMKRLEGEIVAMTAQRDRLAEEHARWEKRVSLLSPGNIDPDLLDERVRAVLNLAHSEDVVVFLESDGGSVYPEFQQN